MANTFPTSSTPALNPRNQSIRKTIVAFSSLFKDIPFIKYRDDGSVEEQIKVPIVYSNKEKYIKRLDGDPDDIDTKVQITLPRIEYGLLNIEYDASRRLNQANKIVGCSSPGTGYVSPPVPYDFHFEWTLYTRNIEDANQILEYVLPFFYPDYNIKINMIPELGIIKSIPISLNNESQDEDSTGVFDSPVRSVFRTLQFTAKSYIYSAPKFYKPILQAETYIYVDSTIKEFRIINPIGQFNINDKVFQGQSYDRATARGVIEKVHYGANSNTVVINSVIGDFKANTTLKSIFNTANCIIDFQLSGLAYDSIITPVPDTYPVTGPYDYNIIIHDYTA